MMRICSDCQSENYGKSPYCEKCGAKLPLLPELNSSSLNEQAASSLSQPLITQRTSGFAIAGLTLSLVCPFIAILLLLLLLLFNKMVLMAVLIPVLILPFILCLIALLQIKDEQGPLRGRGVAIGGLTCSILIPLFIVIIFPLAYRPGTSNNPQSKCMSNQRQIAMAIAMFCTENEETMPGKPGLTPWSSSEEKQQWRTEDIQGVASELFNCKGGKRSGGPGAKTAEYAMNADIMGVGLGQIPAPVATLLTADAKGTDAIFSCRDIDARHNGEFVASFVDGHCSDFTKAEIPSDPIPTKLLTGSNTVNDYCTVPPPSANKIIIQGATNVIDMKLKDWKSKPVCFANTGNKMLTFINAKDYAGCYVSAFFSQLPTKGTPRDVVMGTFTNGYAADYAGMPPVGSAPYGMQKSLCTIVIPAAAVNANNCYTFWLPPAVGNSPERGYPAYTGYVMTGNGVPRVRIVPGVQ